MLLLRVEHKDGVRQTVHATDSAEVALQLLKLATEDECFLLRHVFEVAGRLHPLVLLHLLDAAAYGREVGEHATEPALVDVGHTATIGITCDRILRLLLGTDEQDCAAAGDEVAHVGVGRFNPVEGLIEVDDVDTVAFAVDETLHLRVPTTGLVTEVHARVEQLPHRDYWGRVGHG